MTYTNPITGRITSKFGNRLHPVKKVTSFHNGVDIAAAIGTRIVAPANGTVNAAWDHERGGVCLAMVDENGVRFGFAHLQKRLVKNGDKVLAGQHIANSGNSGASTGPHLHFTVQFNGVWIDPLNYFTFK
jgi:murein DD-endopeptidase MepM/ murein hydrolase activator NlpD